MRGNISEYIETLQQELSAIGAQVPSDFGFLFSWHTTKLDGASYEDLGSLLLIECLEAKQSGVLLDAKELRKSIDRVRHRISREALAYRQRHQPWSGEANVSRVSPPDQRSIDIETVRDLLHGLSSRELKAIEMWMEDASAVEIAQELGISYANARQIINRTLYKLRRRAANTMGWRD
jgi:DNA-binding CsgD family transcriptional regulator